MELSRERFEEHFHIVLMVQGLKSWPTKRRTKRQLQSGAPIFISKELVEWLRISNGKLQQPQESFIAPTDAVIEDFYRRIPYGQTPDPTEFANALYDAFTAAGLSIKIGEPLDTVRPRP